ncbi:rhodanese-like domain-containing protein [Thalassobellus citreus]|uniref:rhodanese-like domain-containing protein n=1 Tax=Thalassobellus citreus TaxID=3367752 RepID=UPI00379D2CB9
MKELEKIKRLSIASTLFILIILIGLLTYKRPKNTYAHNTKNTLEELSNYNYFGNLNDINNQNLVLVDIRSAYEYEKGHLKNAINIHTPDLLNEENLNIFKELKSTNKTAILYGNSPQEVNMPFLLLYQLGYDNIKILPAKNSYIQNKLITKHCDVETSKADITAFIKASQKNGNAPAVMQNLTPKRTITVRKKKKRTAEGGC